MIWFWRKLIINKLFPKLNSLKDKEGQGAKTILKIVSTNTDIVYLFCNIYLINSGWILYNIYDIWYFLEKYYILHNIDIMSPKRLSHISDIKKNFIMRENDRDLRENNVIDKLGQSCAKLISSWDRAAALFGKSNMLF